jgi:hypothetical protein
MKRVQRVKMGFGAIHVKRRVQVDVKQQHVICSLVCVKNALMVSMEMIALKNATLDVIQR